MAKWHNMRRLLIGLAGLLLLSAVNYTIYQREQLLAHGRLVLLELVPVDPRSMMQGDYMALRFRVASEAFRGGEGVDLSKSRDGRLVVALDARGVARFVRFADATPPAANEVLLRYRIRDGREKFASNAFFFEEGQAKAYQKARYGEFRVADNGEMILTNLRDADLLLLDAGKP